VIGAITARASTGVVLVRVELAIGTPRVRRLREDHARAGTHQKLDGGKVEL
jgi:hypothetical protein